MLETAVRIAKMFATYVYQSEGVQMRGQYDQRQLVVNRRLGILIIGRLQYRKEFALNDGYLRLFVRRVMGTGNDELNLEI